jgi:uroporphyrinogen decarboxylase
MFNKMNVLRNIFQGKECDRPGIWYMRQAGRTLPSYLKIRKDFSFAEMMGTPDLAAKITLLPVNDLGVDGSILFSDILVIPEALGMNLEWTEKGPKFTEPLYQYKNPSKRLVADAGKLEHVYAAIDSYHIQNDKDAPLIGFCGAPFTTLCYMVQGLSSNPGFPEAVNMIYQNREEAKKILEKITELSIIYAKNQIKHGIEAFQLFDTHAGLIPSDLYFELIMPYVNKISKAVREEGIPFIFLPKGIGAAISRFTPEHCDFISIDWQTSLFDAHKLVHPELGIQGNIDPRMIFADKNVIEKELIRLSEFWKLRKKWIFNLGHGFLPKTPFENAKFMTDWLLNHKW